MTPRKECIEDILKTQKELRLLENLITAEYVIPIFSYPYYKVTPNEICERFHKLHQILNDLFDGVNDIPNII